MVNISIDYGIMEKSKNVFVYPSVTSSQFEIQLALGIAVDY